MGHSHNHTSPNGTSKGAGHNHCPAHGNNNRKRVGIAAVLTGLFMMVEIVGGLISGSLALLADAGHMMTDFVALTMAWGAFTLAKKPATWRLTFGYDRFTILAAFINGLTLFAIAVWIIVEAVLRFQNPGQILAGPMLLVAIAGLCVNILVFWVLMGADRENLNVRGAILHVVGDLLGSVAAIFAAIVIMKTGWMAIDPLLSAFVALLILRSACRLIGESAHILLEGAPTGIDRRVIREDLITHLPRGVDDLHIYVWSVTTERPMMIVQVHVNPQAGLEEVSQAIKARLKSEFEIEYATVAVSRSEPNHT